MVSSTLLYTSFELLVLFVGNEEPLSLCAKQQTVRGESQLFRVPGGKDLMSKITISVKNEGVGQYQLSVDTIPNVVVRRDVEKRPASSHHGPFLLVVSIFAPGCV